MSVLEIIFILLFPCAILESPPQFSEESLWIRFYTRSLIKIVHRRVFGVGGSVAGVQRVTEELRAIISAIKHYASKPKTERYWRVQRLL